MVYIILQSTRVLKCVREHVCVAFKLQKLFSLAAALMDVYTPRITLLGFVIGWYQTSKTRGEAEKKEEEKGRVELCV